MTGQTRSLKVMYSALNGQVHYDFMCSIIGPAGRLFASFNQVEIMEGEAQCTGTRRKEEGCR